MLTEYYRSPHVRARLLEFMGGTNLGDVTAEYITADGDSADVQFPPHACQDLWKCLDAQQEIGRSLWDRESFVVDLDIEYVNFDQPAMAFVQPRVCYELQEPVVNEVQRWLRRFGIAPLHWVSGQGHHFAWKLSRDSDAFHQLSWLGQLNSSLRGRYQRPSPPNGKIVGLDAGAAFAGLGMVMEYIAEEIQAGCQSKSEIPVMLTAVEAGQTRQLEFPQREIIALDISEYGDPLDARGVRMPFSVYLKPGQKRYQLGNPFVDAMPHMFPIPVFEMDTLAAVELMRNKEGVAELAERCSTTIPDCSAAMTPIVESYKQSPLAEFHRSFYEDSHDAPERWPQTYDRTPLAELPFCVRSPLQNPNDLLLKPAVIQNVVRTLISIGWTPRHIAGLIRSKYERDHGWGERWYRYDASSRADFYTRLFSGAIATGRDQLIDFNCVSTQEKRYCDPDYCDGCLTHFRDLLLANQRR